MATMRLQEFWRLALRVSTTIVYQSQTMVLSKLILRLPKWVLQVVDHPRAHAPLKQVNHPAISNRE